MFLIGFRSFSDKFEFYTRNHSHKQSSLLDTIFNYIFYFGAPGNIYRKVEKTDNPSIVNFGDLSIDIFLEAQDKKYS